MSKKYVSIFILVLITSALSAQVYVPISMIKGLDISRDSTTLGFYQSVHSSEITEAFELPDPMIRTSLNSAHPRGFNDGAVWKGKGITTEIHAGIAGRFGVFSYTLYPVVYYSQNLEPEIFPPSLRNGISQYNYQFTARLGGIDWVQRYGSSSFAAFHPGQSELKLQIDKFITSVSTQNYSVGPSVFNPIILSRQAGGFPHLRIGSTPFDIKIKDVYLGKTELNFVAGFLQESDYFDENDENDQSYFNALFFTYSPPFFENLTLGFNKALYKQTNRFSAQDLISVIHILDTVGPNDQFDQLASATMEWKFPEVGFRAYMEFAYNDFGGFFKWIEPEHSRAYTIGFEKESTMKNGDEIHITYEHTNLSRNHTFLWRAEPTYYIHSVNRQGYTNRGQLLGAGIGPGSNSDILKIDYTHKKSVIGFFGSRIEYNKDYLVVNIGQGTHDIEYGWGGHITHNFEKLQVFGEGIYSRSRNRYYIQKTHNFYLSLGTLIHLN